MEFAVEKLRTAWDDAMPLAHAHWDETVSDKSAMPFDLNPDAYLDLEKAGELRIFTAREEGKLVGYITYKLSPPGCHSATSRRAVCIDIFLAPAYRKGRNGINFMRFAQEKLMEEKIDLMVTSLMIDAEAASRIMIFLGHKPVEVVFTKNLRAN